MNGQQFPCEHTEKTTHGPARHGVTLIEMLVAMAISLIMMAAVANLFAVVGSSVSASRASITQSEHLRSARNRLQADLAGMTAPTTPPLRPEDAPGYFEYFEGVNSVDYSAFIGSATWTATALTTAVANYEAQNVDTLTGDVDDVLLFTTRSKDGQPFVGKFLNGGSYATIESQTAEVAYFTVQNGRSISLTGTSAPQALYTLYRRALLVAPEYNASIAGVTSAPLTFFNDFDLSAHYDTVNTALVLNTMSDLTKRENRFAHDPTSPQFMYPLFLPPPAGYLAANPPSTQGATSVSLQGLIPFTGSSGRAGEDVLLTNVLSFDVKAYDPTVPVYLYSSGGTSPVTMALVPSDIGYWNASSIAGYGAFVDLGYGDIAGQSSTTPSVFFHQPNYPLDYIPANGQNLTLGQWGAGTKPSAYNAATSPTVFGYTYDTWSLHYEGPGPWNNYINYSSTAKASSGYSGINGFDDNGDGVVDDPGEFQYPPPYSAPLRGIQVKIRTYEPDSKQIREVTIVQDFVPQ